jgi:alkylated DNA repair dioxygenase AlkB
MEVKQIADGGIIYYDAEFFKPQVADKCFAFIKDNVPFKQESSYNRPFPRLTAWYADSGLTYSYSGVTHNGLSWTPILFELKIKAESLPGSTKFNSLLINFYRNGKDSIGWHADDEKELGANPIVASFSFGATRRFLLRHKNTKEQLEYSVTHGSVIIMAGTCQHYWHHSVPKTTQEIGERINLTFRKIHE